MSHDPFHDLFDSEIPRPASAASTRSTLDTLAPQFQRAKARRRARAGAVAAFAVLGTTGGAAALGVGPVALNNGPRANHNPVASSAVEENTAESTPTTEPTTTEPTTTAATVIVTTTTSTTVPDIEVTTPVPAEDNSHSAPAETEIESGKPDSNDHADDEHKHEDEKSSKKDGHDPSNPSDDDSEPSDPVAGPLTKSVDEGSATVNVGPNGLYIVDITPATGMGYEVKTAPDSIDIEFHDLVSGDELTDLEFKLVGGGITVKVDYPH